MNDEVLGIILRLKNLPAFQAGLRRAQMGIRRIGDASDRARAKALAAGGALEKFGKFAKLAAGVGLFGLAVGLKRSVGLAADFEQQLSALGSVSDANRRQMAAFRREAMNLGASTKYSALEVAKAQTELAKGGLLPREITGGATRAALAMAAAGELELADAAMYSVNAMKQFRLSARDSIMVADAFATAANRTTADVSDFGMALSQGGGAAAAAGLSFNETIAQLEALADSSVKGSDAGTSMRAMLTQLASPTSKRAIELTRELGLSFFDQYGNMRRLPAMAGRLRQAFDGMTRKQRLGAATTLVGVDGMRSLLSLYNAGPRRIRAYMDANLRQGSAAAVAARKQDNFRGKLEQFQGALETLGIAVGSALLPTLRDLTVGATDVVEALSRPEVINGFRRAVRGVVDVISAAVDGIKWWVKEFKDSNPVIVAITGAVAGLTVGLMAYQLGLKLAAAGQLLLAMTNPITAVMALAGAFVFMYLKVRWFRDAVNSVWSWIKNNWTLLRFTLLAPFLPLTLTVENIINGNVMRIIKGAWGWIKNSWGNVKGFLTGAFTGVAGFVTGVFESVKRTIEDAINFVVDRINDLADAGNAVSPGNPFGHSDYVGHRGLEQDRRQNIMRPGDRLTAAPPGILNQDGTYTDRRGRRHRWPGQAAGGITTQAGASWVGERGPELLHLPRGAQVRPLISPRTGGSLKPAPVGNAVGGPAPDAGPYETIVMQVLLDKKVIAEAVHDQNRRKAARR